VVLAKAQAAPSAAKRGKSQMSQSWLEYEQLGHIWNRWKQWRRFPVDEQSRLGQEGT
jgi:hypothetical protein